MSLRLTLALWMLPWLAAPAQQPADAKLLQVLKLTPPSPGKLATGSRLTVEIRCTNPQKDPVLVFATPLSKGRTPQNCVVSGALPTLQGEPTVSRWISFKTPGEIDEIKITMVDAADQKKGIAMIKVPVQLAWEGEPIPANQPGPVVPPASEQALRLTLVGYEVSQDAASAFFRLPPAEWAPDKLLAALVQLTAKGSARLVKLPELDVTATKNQGVAPAVNGYKLEGLLQRGRGGYVETIYSLRAGDQFSITNTVLMRIGQPVFLGSMPGAAADKLILIFARVSEI